MRHFHYLPADVLDDLFYLKPIPFSRTSSRDLLAFALGATLYMPGTRDQISNDVLSGKYLKGKHEGLTSMAICLEDSIGDHEVEHAEENTVRQLQTIKAAIESGAFPSDLLPIIFIRVREAEQMTRMLAALGSARELLCGFIFPKFSPSNGHHFFESLVEGNKAYSLSLYGMPILESYEIIYKEHRMETLVSIKEILDSYHPLVLNVRIGATDFSGLFGIRRSSDTTIYDISVIRDCITDIINMFGRSSKEYVISGPVWEYFSGSKRIMKPQIRQSPFQQAFGRTGLEIRTEMINRFEDALIHEILMDKTNGLVGKTVIHPSHIKVVHSLNVVTHEEYLDAKSILDSLEGAGGVFKSAYSNKMNEVKPHTNWARKVLLKSSIYGVLHEQQSFIDLLNTEHSEQSLAGNFR
ncbi:citrate lyase subunit beta [Bacillus mangrovi]|uniref:Citrate lyase subunit beta n=1 Tax=Metabacillus mangrovi TaxID=1491830 RepID=A0A7X2V6F8_9BACI|nr:HpcH/HpaI aldolase/citrate lyase family protein [Metabacillus mangrovi]MTH55201.1 citrate lyase subunit beta [Metabacillus mangrovi]